jgi:hypothetical protein
MLMKAEDTGLYDDNSQKKLLKYSTAAILGPEHYDMLFNFV